MKKRLCTADIEILTVSLRPYYVPREYSHVMLTVIYIPLSADARAAANTLTSHIVDMDSTVPDALRLVTGDFNHCRFLKKDPPGYFQHVTCTTRGDKTLDLCYSNVRDAYTSVATAPIGCLDLNTIMLLPRYRPVVLREPPKRRTVKAWSAEA